MEQALGCRGNCRQNEPASQSCPSHQFLDSLLALNEEKKSVLESRGFTELKLSALLCEYTSQMLMLSLHDFNNFPH